MDNATSRVSASSTSWVEPELNTEPAGLDEGFKMYIPKLKEKLNSVAFSPQANYTDRATAAC
jgi:hypothetical protein